MRLCVAAAMCLPPRTSNIASRKNEMSTLLTALVAFGAGILSFLSPCVLPLVPAYLGHLAGVSVHTAEDRRTAWRTVVHASFFVLGFSMVFVLVWVSVGVIGYLAQGYTFYLRYLGGVVLVVFGLHMAGVFRLPWLAQDRRLRTDPQRPPSLFTSWLIGVTFAAGWTPCVGPILAGIIALASTRETVAQGGALLAFYTAGLGVPFLLTAWGLTHAVAFLRRLNRYGRTVEVVSGAFLIVVGFLMFTNTFAQLSRYFAWIPVF